MSMYSGLRVIHRIEVASTGPRVARGIVADELAERVRSSKLDELILLVSEIVTHRIAQACDEPTLTLDLRADRVVRCGVIDDGPAALPAGLGLELVDQLAGRWGVTRSHKRTHTWIETEATDAGVLADG